MYRLGRIFLQQIIYNRCLGAVLGHLSADRPPVCTHHGVLIPCTPSMGSPGGRRPSFYRPAFSAQQPTRTVLVARHRDLQLPCLPTVSQTANAAWAGEQLLQQLQQRLL
ncbi:hypothetical protein HBI54_057650 [Parastagonospora nodorum]|nr:hypothetical protein HBI54_057650 [Parastagonospora nodorum]